MYIRIENRTLVKVYLYLETESENFVDKKFMLMLQPWLLRTLGQSVIKSNLGITKSQL
jgi:hypothetical protein